MEMKERDEVYDILVKADKEYTECYYESFTMGEWLLLQNYRNWLLNSFLQEWQ